MAIDWHGKLVSRDGRVGTLLPREGWQIVTGNTKRRVLIQGDWQRTLPKTDKRNEVPNVVLYDEDGRCRGDGKDCALDLVNEAA